MLQSDSQQDVYAVIDLGSNSFHMLIAKTVAGGLQTIGRVKRKVRLAAGLNQHNELSLEAMQRGWECLALFAERLQDIPRENISVVATATLRLAKNASDFQTHAEKILGHKVNVISGELEAKTIYKGVAYTSSCSGQQLVIDIGGASTEVVIGQGFSPLHYTSLDMGCVTYLEKYFKDGQLSQNNFAMAINAAKEKVAKIAGNYKNAGWEIATGASGTVQAVQEIMVAQRQDDLLTLEKLLDIKEQACQFKTIDELALPGLVEERRLVFVSGLAILIALFESLEIGDMGLAGGALREGVLYSMIPELQQQDIRERTLGSLMSRYHVDQHQAFRVAELARVLADNIDASWSLSAKDGVSLLLAAARLHEIGLLIEYKQYQKHTAYILKNTDMPGYSQSEHKIITALVLSHKADIVRNNFAHLGANELRAERLTRILRLAVILSMRRKDDVLPAIHLAANKESLELTIDGSWLTAHPLMKSELELECEYQRRAEWTFKIRTN